MNHKCCKCGVAVTEKSTAWYGLAPKTKRKEYWCVKCGEKFNEECKKNMPISKKIFCDVDDEIYTLMKKVQKKYKLTWIRARNAVNRSIREMYGLK